MGKVVQRRVTPQAPRNRRVRARPAGSALFSALAWEEIARSLALSGRELQIVRGLFDDKTELDIAGELGISPHTVHTHIERLHHKLALSNRAQILVLVTREYLTLTASPDTGLPAICPHREAGRCPLDSG